MQSKSKSVPPRPFTGLLMGSLGGVSQTFSVLEAQRRCALTALATERYRRRNGGVRPNSLAQIPAELLSEPALDPFTKAPLRYAERLGGFIV